MDSKEVMEKVEAMHAAESAAAGQEGAGESGASGESAGDGSGEPVIDIEPKAEITYDDFAKLQFQVGVIVKCEAVPKSKAPR